MIRLGRCQGRNRRWRGPLGSPMDARIFLAPHSRRRSPGAPAGWRNDDARRRLGPAFYLAGSEAGFRHAGLFVFQIQLTRRIDTLPITRVYMAAPEDALMQAENS